MIWEGFGDFQPSDVHKQYGICFRTPRYHNLEVEQNIAVKMQLRRPSDGAVSDSRSFEFTPINGGRFWASKRLKSNYSLFNNILTSEPSFTVVSTSGISVQSDTLRRKIPTNSQAASSNGLASPDSTMHHIVVQPPASSLGQITQPIQLVHASNFPPPPSPVKGIATTSAAPPVTCQTPDLPPPPTPLFEEAAKSPPPRAANMNLRPISDAHRYQDCELMTVTPTPSNEEGGGSNNMNVTTTVDMTHKDDVNNDVYDEVIPIVYDDVDTKYDGMDFSGEPPAPPIRKRLPSMVANTVPPTPIEEPNRPLPQTPSKRPSLMSKFKSDKKERGRSKKKESKEEAVGENGNRPTSLFQRLFNRSKSVEPSLASPPPASAPDIPPHKDDNGNESMVMDENSGDMKMLQDFIDGPGNLEQLDNMVTEFAKEYINDDEAKNEANGNVAS